MGNGRLKTYKLLWLGVLSGIVGFTTTAGIYGFIFVCDVIGIVVTGNNYINTEKEYLFKDFIVITVVCSLLAFLLFANELMSANKKKSILNDSVSSRRQQVNS